MKSKGRNDPRSDSNPECARSKQKPSHNKGNFRSSTGTRKGFGANSRQVIPVSNTDYGATHAYPLHKQPTIYNPSVPCTTMIKDHSMNRRQAENKKSTNKHLALNPQMDSRALARRDAAQRTRLLIQRNLLVKKTETTRSRPKITPGNKKDPETVNGMRSMVEIEAEERSKRRVGLMLNDELYEYNHGCGVDTTSTPGHIITNSMNPSTKLGPIV